MPSTLMPRPPLLLTAFVLLWVVALPASAAEPSARTPVVASDLLKIKQLEAPVLSPDGKWVAYVVRAIEPKPDQPDDWRARADLWLAATDGSIPPRPLTFSHDNTAPVWSPSGDRLAFVRLVEKEKPQVWILPIGGGEAWPLTKLETGARQPQWSPDGTKIAFATTFTFGQVRAALEKARQDSRPPWERERPNRSPNDTANHAAKPADQWTEEEKAALPKADPDGDLAARREWLAQNEAAGNPRVTTRLNLLGETDLDPVESVPLLHVVEAREGAEPRPVAVGYTGFGTGAFGATGFAWMSDSRHVVCIGPRDRNEHPDRVRFRSLYLLDSATGEVRALPARDNENYGSPTPSPDGRWIAFTLTEGDPFTSFDRAKVALMPAAGGPPEILTAALDRDAQDLAWNPDSSAIHFTTPSNGRFPLHRVPVDHRDGQRLTWQRDWGIRAYDVGREVLVQVVTSPENPYELHVGTRDGKISRPLTAHNAEWLKDRILAKYEQGELTASNGLKVQYWVMKPPGFDLAKRYPLLLQIHGGPAAMWGPGEQSMWHEFQYYAAQGYVVVFSNPRGSGGYGQEFERANYQDWGAGPTADVLAAVDLVAREPWIDRDRMVVTGGSYAGYLTAWIVGHDHRFKAAVAQRGVYDLATFFGEGTAWPLVKRYFGGWPWEPETRRILERESPITYVANIRTPLLIQHGDVDFRTGVIQSQLLYKSLKVLGRPVEYARYPRASHEMSRSGEPRQRLDSLVRYDEFFRRHIGDH